MISNNLSFVPFDEYKAGRKTYLVFPWGTSIKPIAITAARRFHCTGNHLLLHSRAYVVGDALYLDKEPKVKGQKKVLAVEYIR